MISWREFRDCPVVNDRGCFGLIVPGPKLEDLRRDPRDRGFDAQALVEFTLERCLLTRTEGDVTFPKGHTVWKAR
ncbi:MAG: hypothetical protein WD271_05990 [Acidimicrobiia bacterium]